MVKIINNDVSVVDIDTKTVTVISKPCSIQVTPGETIKLIRNSSIFGESPNHQVGWQLGWSDAIGATGGELDIPYEEVECPINEPSITIKILNTPAKHINVISHYGDPNIETEYKITIV